MHPSELQSQSRQQAHTSPTKAKQQQVQPGRCFNTAVPATLDPQPVPSQHLLLSTSGSMSPPDNPFAHEDRQLAQRRKVLARSAFVRHTTGDLVASLALPLPAAARQRRHSPQSLLREPPRTWAEQERRQELEAGGRAGRAAGQQRAGDGYRALPGQLYSRLPPALGSCPTSPAAARPAGGWGFQPAAAATTLPLLSPPRQPASTQGLGATPWGSAPPAGYPWPPASAAPGQPPRGGPWPAAMPQSASSPRLDSPRPGWHLAAGGPDPQGAWPAAGQGESGLGSGGWGAGWRGQGADRAGEGRVGPPATPLALQPGPLELAPRLPGTMNGIGHPVLPDDDVFAPPPGPGPLFLLPASRCQPGLPADKSGAGSPGRIKLLALASHPHTRAVSPGHPTAGLGPPTAYSAGLGPSQQGVGGAAAAGHAALLPGPGQLQGKEGQEGPQGGSRLLGAREGMGQRGHGLDGLAGGRTRLAEPQGDGSQHEDVLNLWKGKRLTAMEVRVEGQLHRLRINPLAKTELQERVTVFVADRAAQHAEAAAQSLLAAERREQKALLFLLRQQRYSSSGVAGSSAGGPTTSKPAQPPGEPDSPGLAPGLAAQHHLQQHQQEQGGQGGEQQQGPPGHSSSPFQQQQGQGQGQQQGQGQGQGHVSGSKAHPSPQQRALLTSTFAVLYDAATGAPANDPFPLPLDSAVWWTGVVHLMSKLHALRSKLQEAHARKQQAVARAAAAATIQAGWRGYKSRQSTMILRQQAAQPSLDASSQRDAALLIMRFLVDASGMGSRDCASVTLQSSGVQLGRDKRVRAAQKATRLAILVRQWGAVEQAACEVSRKRARGNAALGIASTIGGKARRDITAPAASLTHMKSQGGAKHNSDLQLAAQEAVEQALGRVSASDRIVLDDYGQVPQAVKSIIVTQFMAHKGQAYLALIGLTWRARAHYRVLKRQQDALDAAREVVLRPSLSLPLDPDTDTQPLQPTAATTPGLEEDEKGGQSNRPSSGSGPSSWAPNPAAALHGEPTAAVALAAGAAAEDTAFQLDPGLPPPGTTHLPHTPGPTKPSPAAARLLQGIKPGSRPGNLCGAEASPQDPEAGAAAAAAAAAAVAAATHVSLSLGLAPWQSPRCSLLEGGREGEAAGPRPRLQAEPRLQRMRIFATPMEMKAIMQQGVAETPLFHTAMQQAGPRKPHAQGGRAGDSFSLEAADSSWTVGLLMRRWRAQAEPRAAACLTKRFQLLKVDLVDCLACSKTWGHEELGQQLQSLYG